MDFDTLKDELAGRASPASPTPAGDGTSTPPGGSSSARSGARGGKASVTGVSIAELGVIEAVIYTSQNDIPLPVKQFRTLVDAYGDLAATGCSWAY
jgi:hypothetical protein